MRTKQLLKIMVRYNNQGFKETIIKIMTAITVANSQTNKIPSLVRKQYNNNNNNNSLY